LKELLHEDIVLLPSHFDAQFALHPEFCFGENGEGVERFQRPVEHGFVTIKEFVDIKVSVVDPDGLAEVAKRGIFQSF